MRCGEPPIISRTFFSPSIVGERRRPVAVVEEIVLPLDGLDVGVAGHDPEGIAAFGLGHGERHLAAQAREASSIRLPSA